MSNLFISYLLDYKSVLLMMRGYRILGKETSGKCGRGDGEASSVRSSIVTFMLNYIYAKNRELMLAGKAVGKNKT